MRPDDMFEVVMTGPGGQEVRLDMSRQDLSLAYANAVLAGVRASQKIEEPGYSRTGLVVQEACFPDRLLVTKKGGG